MRAANEEARLLVGGDFNVFFDNIDADLGKPVKKDSVKYLEELMADNDLIDIWRVRNPNAKRFTWRQKSPLIQRRLDFWLVSDSLQDDIVNTSILTAIKTDHSAITLDFNSLSDQPRGPSFWKFNSSLLEDEVYINLMKDNFANWKEEFYSSNDPRAAWDWIKYLVRKETIDYSKKRARAKRENLKRLEIKLNECELNLASAPTQENSVKLDEVKISQVS